MCTGFRIRESEMQRFRPSHRRLVLWKYWQFPVCWGGGGVKKVQGALGWMVVLGTLGLHYTPRTGWGLLIHVRSRPFLFFLSASHRYFIWEIPKTPASN